VEKPDKTDGTDEGGGPAIAGTPHSSLLTPHSPDIRPFSPADYDDALRLWRATEGLELRTADSREGIAAFLDRNPGLSFAARARGELVGAVLCGHDGRRGYLYHLAVAPAYRHHGLGRMLVERALDALERQGLRKCHALVLADNEAGFAFWTRIGWERRRDIGVASIVRGPDPNV
jgi:ribosomal protein S18 acetylase RimI-like enzyme